MLKKFILLMIIILIPTTIFANGSSDRKVVRIIINGDMDKSINQDNIDYDYKLLKIMSQYIGWNCEFIEASWKDGMEMIKSGKADILPSVQKTEERKKILEFTDFYTDKEETSIITRKDLNIKFNDYEAIKKLKIGLYKNNANNQHFYKWCNENKVYPEVVEYKNAFELDKAYTEGFIDAIIIGRRKYNFYNNIVATCGSTNVYFAALKENKKLIEEINEGILLLKEYYPDFEKIFNEKYYIFRNKKLILTKEEENYIEKNPVINLLLERDEYPSIYYSTKDNKYYGIFFDVANEISKKTKLKLNIIGWEETETFRKKLSQGDTKGIGAMVFDLNWADINDVYISPSIFSSGVSIIKKEKDIEPKTVALITGNFTEFKVKRLFPNLKIRKYDSLEECIEAVYKGKVDCTFLSSYKRDYFLSRPKYRNLYRKEIEGFREDIAFFATKNQNPILLSIISKGLASISKYEMQEIINKNIEKKYTIKWYDIYYTNPREFNILCLLFLSLVSFTVAVFKLYTKNKMTMKSLKKATDAKIEFLSNVSHEIRTPMNGILGLIEISEKEEDSKKLKKILKEIDGSGRYLLALINDILDMSKAESRKMKFIREICDISEAMNEVDIILKNSFRDKKINFDFKFINMDYKYVEIDKVRFQQVMINILYNAIKFTPENGKVELVIENMRTIDRKYSDVRVSIKDTGIGMSKEFLEKIFVPFEQENRIGTKKNGTGLGLSIVKKIIDLSGGSIRVNSEIGKGTEFIIEERVRIYDTNEVVSENIKKDKKNKEDFNKKFSGKRILLVEDHPINIKVAKKMLEQKDIVVDVAENGEIAVEKFEASKENYYDAILMDIRMPVMNGIEATTRIRDLDRGDAKEIGIIVMTADTLDDRRESEFIGKINSFLEKPIKSEQLFSELEKIF